MEREGRGSGLSNQIAEPIFLWCTQQCEQTIYNRCASFINFVQRRRHVAAPASLICWPQFRAQISFPTFTPYEKSHLENKFFPQMSIRVFLSEWILPWILHGHFKPGRRVLTSLYASFNHSISCILADQRVSVGEVTGPQERVVWLSDRIRNISCSSVFFHTYLVGSWNGVKEKNVKRKQREMRSQSDAIMIVAPFVVRGGSLNVLFCVSAG